MSPTLRGIAVAIVAVLSFPAAAAAQGPQTEILAELRRLRAELNDARGELRQLRADLDLLKAAQATATPEALPALVEMLQSQVAEQAQTKVESVSRLPVKLFGTIHSSTAFNSGEANWLENPNIVAASALPSTGSFNSTLRQTRLGIRTDGLAIGEWQGSGAVVFDFFGGIPAFQTGPVMGLPRLMYAFTRFERGSFAVHVGQDDMMLAPRNPTSIAAFSFPLLFRSGNLYLRVPQARVESRLMSGGGGEVRGAIGIVAPVGGDFSATDYTFVPPALAGERSRQPGVQGRLAWQQGDDTRGRSAGFSAHYGRERIADAEQRSWAAAIDFHTQGARVGVSGEAFVGDNIDAFGGALGQNIRTAGGFIEARVRLVARWELAVGGGTDRPRAGLSLLQNDSIYSNVTFQLTPEVATSVEYRWLQTTAAAATRRNSHVNWALAYGF